MTTPITLCGVYLRVYSRLGAPRKQAPPTPQRRVALEVVQAAGGEAVGRGVPLEHRQLGVPAEHTTRESDPAQTLRRFWCRLPPARVSNSRSVTRMPIVTSRLMQGTAQMSCFSKCQTPLSLHVGRCT